MTTTHGVPILGPNGEPVGPTIDRDAWKAERGWRLGSTDTAKIAGHDPYGGAWDVWDRIVLGDWKDNDTPGSDIRRGNRQEPNARARFCEVTGFEVVESGMIHVPGEPRIVSDLDGILTGWPAEPPTGTLWEEVAERVSGPGWLELKVPRVARFYEYRDEGLPAQYILQGHHHGAVSGLTWGAFAFYTPEYDDIVAFPVVNDPDLCAWILDALPKWYDRHVDGRLRPKKPTPPGPKFPTRIPGVADIRHDEDWVDASTRVALRKYELDEATAAYEQTAAELIALLEDGDQHVSGHGVKVTRKSTTSQRRFDAGAFKAAVRLAQIEGDVDRLMSIDDKDDAFYMRTKSNVKVDVKVYGPNPAEVGASEARGF